MTSKRVKMKVRDLGDKPKLASRQPVLAPARTLGESVAQRVERIRARGPRRLYG